MSAVSKSSGWIPAYRKLFSPMHHMAGREAVCNRFAWLDLVQMAQHRARKVRGVSLARGELVVSVRYLAKRWRWSRSKVQRYIKRCVEDALIEPKSSPISGTPNGTLSGTVSGTPSGTPNGTVYRIVNYERYAVFHNEGGTPSGTPSGTLSGTLSGTNTNIIYKHLDKHLKQTYRVRESRAQEDAEEIEELLSPVDCSGIVGEDRCASDEELAMLADEVLGLGKLTKNEKALNRMIVREWRYQSSGISDIEIESAIHGLRLMIDQRRPEVERYRPEKGYPLALLRMKDDGSGKRRDAMTLYEQGDGKALRALFDVAEEAWVSHSEAAQKRGGGLQRVSELSQVSA